MKMLQSVKLHYAFIFLFNKYDTLFIVILTVGTVLPVLVGKWVGFCPKISNDIHKMRLNSLKKKIASWSATT